MKKKNKPTTGIELSKSTENKILETFGSNLKRVREKKNFSQESVAYASGLSRSYYADVENGRRNLSLINISKILAATDTGFEKLLPPNELKKLLK